MVGVGQQAVFRCQNLDADFIVWRVNETQVTFNNPHPDPNIIIRTTMDGSDVVNLLSIAAQSKYNETVITCIADSIGGGSNVSTPVKLLIQGELAPNCVIVYLTGKLGGQLNLAVQQSVKISYYVILLCKHNNGQP